MKALPNKDDTNGHITASISTFTLWGFNVYKTKNELFELHTSKPRRNVQLLSNLITKTYLFSVDF